MSADKTKQLVLSACARWHDRPISSLRYAEIDDLLCEIRDGSKRRQKAPYAANRAHAHLKTFFKWCVRTKRLLGHPCRRCLGRGSALRHASGHGSKARRRTRSSRRCGGVPIRWVWTHAKFIKLLLITGKRRMAIQEMTWQHIDRVGIGSHQLGSKTKRCHADTVATARTAHTVATGGQG